MMQPLDLDPRRPDRGMMALVIVSVAVNAFLLFALTMRTLDLYRARAVQVRVIELRLGRSTP